MIILQQILQVENGVISSSSQMLSSNLLNQSFLARLAVDLISVFILIRLIYFNTYRKTDQNLSFYSFNLIIFLIAHLLNKVEMSMGAAFGLFAVFSMLRYRTENISIKDMTYLFIVIAIGLLTAIGHGNWLDLLGLNAIILLLIQLLESNWLSKKELTKTLIYDKIELITPERRAEMLQDITIRTGFKAHRVEINNFDLLKDSAEIIIYYYKEN